MSFDSLGLSAEILRALAEKGYLESTPVQQQAIPYVLQGRDIMAQCPDRHRQNRRLYLTDTATARAAPGVAAGRQRRPVRALILTPTRELAAQIGAKITEYTAHLGLCSLVVFGSVSINPQMMKLRGCVEVLVATFGRLLDLA